jgi:hypothetical protein
MAKVCKSDGQGTFAGTQGNGEVAPIPDLPGLAPERVSSTLLGHSASHSERLFLPHSGHCPSEAPGVVATGTAAGALASVSCGAALPCVSRPRNVKASPIANPQQARNMKAGNTAASVAAGFSKLLVPAIIARLNGPMILPAPLAPWPRPAKNLCVADQELYPRCSFRFLRSPRDRARITRQCRYRADSDISPRSRCRSRPRTRPRW